MHEHNHRDSDNSWAVKMKICYLWKHLWPITFAHTKTTTCVFLEFQFRMPILSLPLFPGRGHLSILSCMCNKNTTKLIYAIDEEASYVPLYFVEFSPNPMVYCSLCVTDDIAKLTLLASVHCFGIQIVSGQEIST